MQSILRSVLATVALFAVSRFAHAALCARRRNGNATGQVSRASPRACNCARRMPARVRWYALNGLAAPLEPDTRCRITAPRTQYAAK